MRKKLFLLLEIIIWILLLGGLIFLGVSSAIQRLSNHKCYQIVFNDVDSLIIGAPVRVMGIQVGNVTAVKPLDDKVYVSFIITDNKVTIPDGSNVSIQFTGIAGSKSLEITPPRSHVKNSKNFNVSEPIRINSLMELQSDISKTILSTCNSALNLFGTSPANEIKANIKLSARSSTETIKVFDDAARASKQINLILSSEEAGSKKFFDEQNKNINIIRQTLGPSFNKDTKQAFYSLKDFTHQSTTAFEENIVKNFSRKSANDIKNFENSTNTFSQEVNKLKSNAPNLVGSMDDSINSSFGGLNNMLYGFGNTIKSDNIKQLDSNSKYIKNYMENLNKNF